MNTPERFYHVSQSQLSIARHYGGIRFNGVYYVYNPQDDTLTRDDIVKADRKAKMAKKNTKKLEAKQAHGEFEL